MIVVNQDDIAVYQSLQYGLECCSEEGPNGVDDHPL